MSLTIKEIQIKETWRFLSLPPFRMVIIKETMNAGANVEREMREPFFFPGGNVN